LPPGEHKLSVMFTPEDQERYAKTKATVTLIVERPPNGASLLKAVSQTPLASGAAAQSVPVAAERRVERKEDRPAQRLQRETRTYKGAIYEKGDDGQWHRQPK
jgi:hypothetical protein